jgi:hypothetical protein
MKMTIQKFSEAYNIHVSGGAEELPVIFSQNGLDGMKIEGKPASDLEARICENSAPQTPHSRRARHGERASSMAISRICG